MKRNNNPSITVGVHPDDPAVIIIGGRLDNEITSPQGDLTLTVMTGWGRSVHHLRWKEECQSWVCLSDNFAKEFILGLEIPAKEHDPVVVEVYDNIDKISHYIHDLHMLDLPDAHLDVYHRLIMASDVEGNPLSSHLATEEDFLPILWVSWWYGAYGGRIMSWLDDTVVRRPDPEKSPENEQSGDRSRKDTIGPSAPEK